MTKSQVKEISAFTEKGFPMDCLPVDCFLRFEALRAVADARKLGYTRFETRVSLWKGKEGVIQDAIERGEKPVFYWESTSRKGVFVLVARGTITEEVEAEA
jgi:hypothetical protein